MKKKTLLKQFNYSIPSSAIVFSNVSEHHVVTEHLPLMYVSFDFENGKMKLEGDWQFMMLANKHNEANWFTYHRNRVKISAEIYPAGIISLDEEDAAGMVLPLDGTINDGESIGTCSGLIVVDNEISEKEGGPNQWVISFYIYDLQFEYCEIKFRVPLYLNALTEINN